MKDQVTRADREREVGGQDLPQPASGSIGRRETWKLDDGRTIHLVTPREFSQLPDGSVLIAIDGERVVKGVDFIDDDTRGDFLAFGILQEFPS